MKLSTMIEFLQAVEKEDGDVEAYVGWKGNTYEIESLGQDVDVDTGEPYVEIVIK